MLNSLQYDCLRKRCHIEGRQESIWFMVIRRLPNTTWWKWCLLAELLASTNPEPPSKEWETSSCRPRRAHGHGRECYIQPPESFVCSCPSEWPKRIRRFECFRTAAELTAKEEDMQVKTLIYAMGGEADDILRSFSLSDADQKKYSVVKKRFEEHFVNVVYERANFNSRRQEGRVHHWPVLTCRVLLFRGAARSTDSRSYCRRDKVRSPVREVAAKVSEEPCQSYDILKESSF